MSLQRNGKSKKIDEATRRLQEAEMKQEREVCLFFKRIFFKSVRL